MKEASEKRYTENVRFDCQFCTCSLLSSRVWSLRQNHYFCFKKHCVKNMKNFQAFHKISIFCRISVNILKIFLTITEPPTLSKNLVLLVLNNLVLHSVPLKNEMLAAPHQMQQEYLDSFALICQLTAFWIIHSTTVHFISFFIFSLNCARS